MQLPLQLSVRNTTLSAEAEALVRRYAAKLETFYDHIMGCRVMVEVPQKFPTGGSVQYHVRIDLTVPGDEIVTKRPAHPELRTAIQEAFDAAGRRLQDYARRQRGDVKRRPLAERR